MIQFLKYFIYRLQWKFPFLSKGPIHLDIETNNNCNQKCIMCWHSTPRKRPFKIFTADHTDVILRTISGIRAGAKSIKFNLRGEPSAYKKIDRAVLVASAVGYTDVMMNTNGIMSEGKFVALAKWINTMIVSVDSFNVKTYMKIHGAEEEQFYQLISNLETARELGIKLKINIHLNKFNREEFSKKAIKSFKKWYKPFKFIIRDTEKREGKDISNIQKPRKRKKVCPHMARRLTVLSNGRTYPCCVCYKEPDDIFLGHVDNGILNIWQGRKRKKLIEDYKKGIYTDTCKNCTSGDIWK